MNVFYYPHLDCCFCLRLCDEFLLKFIELFRQSSPFSMYQLFECSNMKFCLLKEYHYLSVNEKEAINILEKLVANY